MNNYVSGRPFKIITAGSGLILAPAGTCFRAIKPLGYSSIYRAHASAGESGRIDDDVVSLGCDDIGVGGDYDSGPVEVPGELINIALKDINVTTTNVIAWYW
jgi:hypothetical protein